MGLGSEEKSIMKTYNASFYLAFTYIIKCKRRWFVFCRFLGKIVKSLLVSLYILLLWVKLISLPGSLTFACQHGFQTLDACEIKFI